MEFRANEGKNVNIVVNGRTYARHAIQTHFVQVGESYVDLVEQYVKPLYQPGTCCPPVRRLSACVRSGWSIRRT